MGKLNSCNFIGNLGRDPEMRETANGAKMVTFSLATDRGFGERKETVWIDCTAWCGRDGKTATGDIILKYVKKGQIIHVEGELDNPSVGNDKNGESRASNKLRVNKVVLLTNKSSESDAELDF